MNLKKFTNNTMFSYKETGLLNPDSLPRAKSRESTIHEPAIDALRIHSFTHSRHQRWYRQWRMRRAYDWPLK
ncbi:MAG: hypothetical protein JSV99_04070 [Planctomycetota bacterium]|nr:MAG: hypothetical protein JSV99_04070 [Planctomycetota bacterium]